MRKKLSSIFKNPISAVRLLLTTLKILILVVSVVILYYQATVTNDGDIPYFVDGTAKTTVVSNSMSPLFVKGDSVTIKKYNDEELVEGTIYIYKKDNKYIIHRLIEIKDDGLLFKGDANDGYDDLVDVSQIEAVYVCVSGNGLSKWSWTSICLICALGVIEAIEVVVIKKTHIFDNDKNQDIK